MKSRLAQYPIAILIAVSLAFSGRIWWYALFDKDHFDLKGEAALFMIPSAVCAVLAIVLSNRLFRHVDERDRVANALLVLSWVALVCPWPAALLME